MRPMRTTSRGHQSITKCLKEKGTIRNEKIMRKQPRKTKATEGTTKRMRMAPKRCHPAGKRASPAKTDSRGQLWEKVKGRICREERKRKNPTRRKKAAKNKYRDRLFNLMAKKAQMAPIITKKKALSMEKRAIPWRVPRRKALPRNISSSPVMNARRAAALRVVDLSIPGI
jgi:hypothetical protein